jgi:hypothetical protein
MPKRYHEAAFSGGIARLSFLSAEQTDIENADEDTKRAVADFRELKQIEVFGRNVPAPLPQFESTQFQGVRRSKLSKHCRTVLCFRVQCPLLSLATNALDSDCVARIAENKRFDLS